MLTIRPATPDDAPSIWAMHQDNWELFRTDYDLRSWDTGLAQEIAGSKFCYLFCSGDIPVLVAYCDNIYFDRHCQLHFVGRTAHDLLRIDFSKLGQTIFEETGINKLKACILSTQSVARKLLERNNFRRVGTMKEDTMKDGKPVDVILYELTRKRFYDGQK